MHLKHVLPTGTGREPPSRAWSDMPAVPVQDTQAWQDGLVGSQVAQGTTNHSEEGGLKPDTNLAEPTAQKLTNKIKNKRRFSGQMTPFAPKHGERGASNAPYIPGGEGEIISLESDLHPSLQSSPHQQKKVTSEPSLRRSNRVKEVVNYSEQICTSSLSGKSSDTCENLEKSIRSFLGKGYSVEMYRHLMCLQEIRQVMAKC